MSGTWRKIKTMSPTHTKKKVWKGQRQKRTNKKDKIRLLLCILIHSSLSTYLLQGLCQVKSSRGEWLTPPNPRGYQKACHYHDICTIFWDVRRSVGATKRRRNSKNNRCEFLMHCVLGHKCTLSTSRGGWKSISPPKLDSFSTARTTTWGSLHFKWAIFCLSLTPAGRLAGMQHWRKCDGKVEHMSYDLSKQLIRRKMSEEGSCLSS